MYKKFTFVPKLSNRNFYYDKGKWDALQENIKAIFFSLKFRHITAFEISKRINVDGDDNILLEIHNILKDFKKSHTINFLKTKLINHIFKYYKRLDDKNQLSCGKGKGTSEDLIRKKQSNVFDRPVFLPSYA